MSLALVFQTENGANFVHIYSCWVSLYTVCLVCFTMEASLSAPRLRMGGTRKQQPKGGVVDEEDPSTYNSKGNAKRRSRPSSMLLTTTLSCVFLLLLYWGSKGFLVRRPKTPKPQPEWDDMNAPLEFHHQRSSSVGPNDGDDQNSIVERSRQEEVEEQHAPSLLLFSSTLGNVVEKPAPLDPPAESSKDEEASKTTVLGVESFLRHHATREKNLKSVRSPTLREDPIAWMEQTVHPNHPNRTFCRPVAAFERTRFNCNLIHEQDRISQGFQLLGNGWYRDAFSAHHSSVLSRNNPEKRLEPEPFVLKQLRYRHKQESPWMVEFVRMDAMVAEALTSSPHIFDLYGYCGVTLLSEAFFHGDIEGIGLGTTKEDVKHVGYGNLQSIRKAQSYNDLSMHQRLTLSWQMAQALADLHGHAHGVIVHGDIHLGQFMYNADQTHIKLIDFNMAQWLLWDDEHHLYCPFTNDGDAPGQRRSPEEYANDPLTEQLDVYSLGNNFYSLLTGLYPWFQHYESDHPAVAAVLKGKRPILHDDWRHRRGFIAQALVLVMEQCWIANPTDRPNIFQVVRMLQRALDQAPKEEDENESHHPKNGIRTVIKAKKKKTK